MAKGKKLTLASLGHVEEGGRFRLCASYANARDNYKVVEDYVIGYAIVGDGVRAPVRVAPIYRATIWQKQKNKRNIVTSYEVGEYLNPPGADSDDPFLEDHVANSVAASMRSALMALEHQSAKRKTQKRGRRG